MEIPIYLILIKISYIENIIKVRYKSSLKFSDMYLENLKLLEFYSKFLNNGMRWALKVPFSKWANVYEV